MVVRDDDGIGVSGDGGAKHLTGMNEARVQGTDTDHLTRKPGGLFEQGADVVTALGYVEGKDPGFRGFFGHVQLPKTRLRCCVKLAASILADSVHPTKIALIEAIDGDFFLSVSPCLRVQFLLAFDLLWSHKLNSYRAS